MISALALEGNTRVMARVLADNAAASLMFLDNESADACSPPRAPCPTCAAAIYSTGTEFARHGDYSAEGRGCPACRPSTRTTT